MDERSKRKKRIKKRQRHEATKKRTRKHKTLEADAISTKGTAEQDVGPPTQNAHSDFMTKKRR